MTSKNRIVANALVAINTSPKTILKKLKELVVKDDYKANQYWQKQTRDDQLDVLREYIRGLDKGSYSRTSIESMIEKDLGRLPSGLFHYQWEQLFWQLADLDGTKFSASTTHGLQVLTKMV